MSLDAARKSACATNCESRYEPRGLNARAGGPYPMRGGGALRTASLLHYLAQSHDVHLIVFRQPGVAHPAESIPAGLVRRGHRDRLAAQSPQPRRARASQQRPRGAPRAASDRSLRRVRDRRWPALSKAKVTRWASSSIPGARPISNRSRRMQANRSRSAQYRVHFACTLRSFRTARRRLCASRLRTGIARFRNSVATTLLASTNTLGKRRGGGRIPRAFRQRTRLSECDSGAAIAS